jgi:hypothetical protein
MDSRAKKTASSTCEKVGGTWRWYQDYVESVSLPDYLNRPDNEFVIPLASGTSEYDYVVQLGHKNIGAWIDLAAVEVGR